MKDIDQKDSGTPPPPDHISFGDKGPGTFSFGPMQGVMDGHADGACQGKITGVHKGTISITITDGILKGHICYDNGQESSFLASRGERLRITSLKRKKRFMGDNQFRERILQPFCPKPAPRGANAAALALQ